MARTTGTARKDKVVEVPSPRAAESRPLVDRHPITRAEIAYRAYEIYELRGRIDGSDFDDWLQAENWLQGERDLLWKGTPKPS
jgi:hypothetical protein